MDSPLYTYNQFGHCKYLSRCRNRHVDIVCEDKECEMSVCEKRHPLKCKYFENFGRCRFNPCSYLHVDVDTDVKSDVKEKDSNLEKQITDIKSEIEQLRKLLSNVDNNFKYIQNICDNNTHGIFQLERSTEGITDDLVSLNEAVDKQTQQINENHDEFSSYLNKVDNLDGKVSYIEKVLLHNKASSLQRPNAHNYSSSPSLPTPPTSRRKKAPP